MRFGDRLRARREELRLSRAQLAERLGISASAISNYETGVSFPKEEVMLRLFDCLETEPDVLFQDSFRAGRQVLGTEERALLEAYRGLSPTGRESVRAVVQALCAYRDEVEESRQQEPRVIPLYHTPAAAGYASPVFGEDYDLIPVEGGVPAGAEFAVRIRGDSMTGAGILDSDLVIVRQDVQARNGDIVIALLEDEATCKTLNITPDGVWLMPENPAYPPIDGTGCQILGVVKAVYREY